MIKMAQEMGRAGRPRGAGAVATVWGGAGTGGHRWEGAHPAVRR